MRIVAAGRCALSRIGGVLLSNLTNQDTAMGLGYKLSGLGSFLVFHEIHDDADAELQAEMSDNRDFLENLIGSGVSHFPFPYGTDKARGVRELYAGKRLRFKSAATATIRSLDDGSSKAALPRLSLTGRFWTSRADWTAPVTRSPSKAPDPKGRSYELGASEPPR
jgi:hypothetical protein